jgi:hypothetical protein
VGADHGPGKSEFVGGACKGTEFRHPAEGAHGLEVFHGLLDNIIEQ